MTALDNSNNESQQNFTIQPCINQNLNQKTSVGPSTSKNHGNLIVPTSQNPNNVIVQSSVRNGHPCKLCSEICYDLETYAQHFKRVHEGPKIAAVVSITDQYFQKRKTIENFQDNSVNSNEQIKQQHNCSFCKEVFGNYPKESFVFNGCFLPNL